MSRYMIVHARRLAGAAILSLVLASGGSALAQSAPPATPVPDVGQPEPPAAQLAAARDVVISSGMARSFVPMVPQLVDQIVPTLTRTRPDLTTALTSVVNDLRPEFLKDGDKMVDIAAHIFARYMSEQDLKDTAAFFNSPAGKKYVESQPQMLDGLVVAMQSWTQTMSSSMMTRVRDEMIKRGHNDF